MIELKEGQRVRALGRIGIITKICDKIHVKLSGYAQSFEYNIKDIEAI